MDQHPIPRQITTFEFKLIGFMTLKQFLYLVIFAPIGYIAFLAIPIPFINILIAVLIGAIGAALAFIPIQDRPMDVWLKHFIKRLNSPTQYTYKKKNNSVYFLKNLFFVSDPHLAVSHIETREKLQEYIQKNAPVKTTELRRDKPKTHIDDLLQQNLPVPNLQSISTRSMAKPPGGSHTDDVVKQPFISGIVKNRKQIPIPGILVSIKDSTGHQLRLLKTNPYGIFATYSPLAEGDYSFEVGDPNGNYFFDTMNVHINPNEQKPLLFYSKEIL
jgi:hypothetical protein